MLHASTFNFLRKLSRTTAAFLILFALIGSSTAFAQRVRTLAEAEKIIHQMHADNINCLIEAQETHQDGTMTISFFEKHTPDCWGGKGDPNTSPRWATYTVDKHGIIWYEDFLFNCSYPTGNYTKPIKTVKNLDTWRHPAKKVFEKYKIRLTELNLFADETYPIFSVDIPEDLTENEKLFARFQAELLKANGDWDCSLLQVDSQIKLEGKKRK